MSKTQRQYIEKRATLNAYDTALRVVGSAKTLSEAYKELNDLRSGMEQTAEWYRIAAQHENKERNDKYLEKKRGKK